MPLIQSASKEALQKNIETEIAAGKDPKQAAAVAYSVQRKNDESHGRRTLYNGKVGNISEYIDVDFDKNTVVMYQEDDEGHLKGKRSLVPSVYASAEEFWKRNKRMQKVDKFFTEKFYNDSSKIKDDVKPEYIGTKVEFAEGNTQDAFHKFVVGRLYPRNELSKLNESLLAFNELSKGRGGYNKVWFDHIIKYNGKKYKLHWGRYDAGSESNATPISNEDINEILTAFERAMKSDSAYMKSALTSLDSATVIDADYVKIINGQPEIGKLVQHEDGYTFMCSNAKQEKDFNTLEEAEEYLQKLNYKKYS